MILKKTIELLQKHNLLKIIDDELYLLYIYDKSKIENLTENEIDKLILKQLEN